MPFSVVLCSVFFGSLNAQQQPPLNKFLTLANSKVSIEKVATQTYHNKVFVIDEYSLTQKGGAIFLKDNLSLSSDNSFTVQRISPTGVDSSKYTVVFQHYYEGVLVEGSGYSAVIDGDSNDVFDIFAKATQNYPPGPGPCSSLSLLNFYIADIKNESLIGTKFDTPSPQDLQDIAMQLDVDSSKVGRQVVLRWSETLGQYEYVNNIFSYNQHEELVNVGYFSNPSGLVVNKGSRGILGQTVSYGTVDLDDSFIDGTQRMISSDGRLSTYDATPLNSGVFLCDRPRGTACDFLLDEDVFIPQTTLNSWPTSNHLDRHVVQSHHVVSLALQEWNTLRIDNGMAIFNNVKVAAIGDGSENFTGRTGTSFSSNSASSFIKIHTRDNITHATYDIAAHELSHVHLGSRLRFTDINSNTFHEAISEMIGVYVESKIQGSIDWQEGDDDPNRSINIDFENLPFECFTPQVLGSNNEYFRGMPLLHWYYLLVTGDASLEIDELGIDVVTDILFKGIELLPSRPNVITDFSDAILGYASVNYGFCSDEYRSILNAFNEICIIDYVATCDFTINGPRSWCEEYTPGRLLSWNLSTDFPNADYYWTFPHEWQILGQRQGNTHIGPFLTVTNIPAYSSYPVIFKIGVYAPQVGANFKETLTLRLNDCDRDDPEGCSIYSEENPKIFAQDDNLGVTNGHLSKSLEEYNFQYYDMSGKNVHSFVSNSTQANIERQPSLPSGLYFVVKLDLQGHHISTTKRIIVK